MSASARVDAWTMVLEELERGHQDGTQHEEQGNDVDHWTPPAGLGPLPAELAPRAAALVTALTEAASRKAAARDEIARQLAGVRAVPLAADAGDPVYLDTSG